jgi:5-methylcytosine-specific restriction enzyme subunit McrC
MSIISICLQEWETRHPNKGSELEGLFLDEDPIVQKIAKDLSDSQLIGIKEYKNGLYLNTFSHVGRIRLGNIQITIRPKINEIRLLHLLQYAYGLRDLRLFSDADFKTEEETFQDLLIYQLYIEANELISRGLHRKYIRTIQDLSSPRGRIDMQKVARRCAYAQTAIPCIHHPRLEDSLINQVLLEGLQRSVQLTEDLSLRSNLRRLASVLLESVSQIELDRNVMKRANRELNRLNNAYQSSFIIIEMLLESEGLSFEEGPNIKNLPGFLFDMNKFFQSLLNRFLQENLRNYSTYHEYPIRDMLEYLPDYNPRNQSSMAPRPDFAIFKGDKIISILDAKYRDLWNKQLPRNMLYQLAIYAVSQGLNGKATILYPAIGPEAKEARIGIEINDPIHGSGLAQISLRPVDLTYLEKLVSKPKKNHADIKKMGDFARWLAFGA